MSPSSVINEGQYHGLCPSTIDLVGTFYSRVVWSGVSMRCSSLYERSRSGGGRCVTYVTSRTEQV